jgi:GNAT superfamily N-acetyltransferase
MGGKVLGLQASRLQWTPGKMPVAPISVQRRPRMRIVIRTATPQDLPALRALFARANDEPYELAAVVEEKCFGPGVAGAPVVRVLGELDGDELEGAVVTCGKYVRILIVDREARRRGIGTALLADADARGASVIAAEPGNYFTPGISDVGSQSFIRARGYAEKAFTWNLEAALGDRSRRLDDSTRRPSHDEAARVLGFIEREFGRIWRFEAAKAFDTEIPQIFVTEEGDAVTGFAAHDVNNRGLGFFGPTGVAGTMRGRGLGCQLLLASLADLRSLGFARAVIPWTDALAFYSKCAGAEPAHRFIAFEKPQP